MALLLSFMKVLSPERGLADLPGALLQQAIEQSFNAVVITDAGRGAQGPLVVYCNPAFSAMTGYCRDEWIGRSPRILQGPLSDRGVIGRLREALDAAADFHGATFNYRKDGSCYLVEWNVSPVRCSEGAVTHFVSVQRDITERALAEQQQALLAQALNVTHDAVFIADGGGRIQFENAAFQRWAEQAGSGPLVRLSDPDCPPFYRNLLMVIQGARPGRFTFSLQAADGGARHLEQTVWVMEASGSGPRRHYVSVLRDITHFVEREAFLSALARQDALTGVLSRRGADEALRRIRQAPDGGGQPLAVILADVDDFKCINDGFGHPVGDAVLKHCAKEIGRHVRAGDSVIRWGGEEFLVLAPVCALPEAAAMAERIRKAVRAVGEPAISLSLGVAVQRRHETFEQALHRADEALYRAKAQGKNRVALSTA